MLGFAVLTPTYLEHAARVHLTPIENRLISVLAANVGKVMTHRSLVREVWGPSHADSTHYVRIQMGHLRRKLAATPR